MHKGGVTIDGKDGDERIIFTRGRMNPPPEASAQRSFSMLEMLLSSSEVMARNYHVADPMNAHSRILANINTIIDGVGDRDEICCICYMAFHSQAGGLVWARDFVFLQYVSRFTCPETGDKIFLASCTSIERPEVPVLDRQCSRIRGTIHHSGVVFRERAAGLGNVSTNVVQVDPRGMVPVQICNLSAIKQAMNLARMAEITQNSFDAGRKLGLPKGQPADGRCLGYRDHFTHIVPTSEMDAGTGGTLRVVVRWTSMGRGQVQMRVGRDAQAKGLVPLEVEGSLSDLSAWVGLTHGPDACSCVAFALPADRIENVELNFKNFALLHSATLYFTVQTTAVSGEGRQFDGAISAQA
ncbi:unnamed protein product [Chrysoparadoxa australica]